MIDEGARTELSVIDPSPDTQEWSKGNRSKKREKAL
jgi:hypothetical protein